MKLKNILGKVFSRNFIFAVLIIVQVLFFIFSVTKIGERFYFVYLFLICLDIVLVIYIMNLDENPSYKLAWIISISIFPLFGGLSYVFIKISQKIPREIGLHYQHQAQAYLIQNNDTLNLLEERMPDSANLAHYVINHGLYPVYRRTSCKYFPLGELQFEAMIEELNNAKRFIFMEFFIISEGYMFDTVSEILVRKAKEGLDVRLMYDGIGTGMLNSSKPFKELQEQGVKCKSFNPFTPFLSSVQNNRDHRKIIVIDGHTAFNGGTNLADEYINRIERFGHWKDTAIMLKGEAVWNYTIMFLQLWEFGEKIGSDFENFLPVEKEFFETISDGFVQPFSDSPLDNENVSKCVYLDMINNARKSICITTPYLILDDEMLSALRFACKKGVDVTIVTPHIPDKWYVHHIAWNTYPKLIEAGVKVYEYTPGFIHAKTLVADEQNAVVGTINFDYRSLYLHYECASILYGCSAVKSICEDFNATVKASKLITPEDCKNRSAFSKIAGFFLSSMSPLL